MTKPSWTGRDIAHLAIVATPLLTLAGMFGVSALTWQVEEARWDREIRQIVGSDDPFDGAGKARIYDANTSPEHTATWKRILSASESLNAKYGGPFAWSRSFETYYDVAAPPGEDWPVAELMSRYAQDAEPILAEIETLLDSDEAIWLPIVFEAWQTRLIEAQKSRGVATLMHSCFLSAIHEGNTDRALMILRAFDRLFGSTYEPVYLVDELVRVACVDLGQGDLRHSLSLGVWSDEQRRELETMLSKPQDWDARWRKVVESEFFAMSPTTLTTYLNSTHLSGMTTLPPISTAPSSLRAMAGRYQAIASVPGAGSRFHIDRVIQVNDRWSSDEGLGSIDRWLQVPSVSSDWIEEFLMPAYGALAAVFADQANDHRFTRTVLALRQFRVRMDRWPHSLGELSQVGLPASATRSPDGAVFGYEITDDDHAILFNTADKNATQISYGVRPESITMRP